jgi:hypothetical protein
MLETEVIHMRTVLRAAIGAAAISLVLAGSALAKGESFGAAIGPIDNVTPGTPTQVSVQVTMQGGPVSRGAEMPIYLSFTDPVSLDIVEFPARWDATRSTYVATVTLPHAGRWSVNALLRFDTLNAEQIGNVTGTRSVTVAAAPEASPPSPIVPALAGAGAASAAWALAIGAYVMRRRRPGTVVANPSMSEQAPA